MTNDRKNPRSCAAGGRGWAFSHGGARSAAADVRGDRAGKEDRQGPGGLCRRHRGQAAFGRGAGAALQFDAVRSEFRGAGRDRSVAGALRADHDAGRASGRGNAPAAASRARSTIGASARSAPWAATPSRYWRGIGRTRSAAVIAHQQTFRARDRRTNASATTFPMYWSCWSIRSSAAPITPRTMWNLQASCRRW